MPIRLDATTEQFLNSLTDATRRINQAQAQISSGKRIQTVSDAPDSITTLLQTRLELDSAQQVSGNLSRFKTEVDTAEGALNSAETILERARSLGAQASSTFVSQEARNAIGEQLRSLEDQIVNIANTNVEGRYVFSGDTDAIAPFSIDYSNTPPYTYAGAATSTRQAVTSDDSRFPVSRTASQIFNSPTASEDVLGAIETLRLAVGAGNQAQIDASMQQVQTAGNYLRVQHAWYGAVQSRVNDAISTASERIARFKTQIGAIEDADLTTSIVQFQQATNQRSAALQAHAQIPRKTLFDYLG